jgi:hypothetical protein
MKTKLRDLKVEPEQGFENLRALGRKVLSVSKTAPKSRTHGKPNDKHRG